MSSTPAVPPVPPVPQTLEQKIDQAALEAAQIVAQFSTQAATVIESGVAVEPVISGLIQLFASIFSHKAKTAVAAPAESIPAAS